MTWTQRVHYRPVLVNTSWIALKRRQPRLQDAPAHDDDRALLQGGALLNALQQLGGLRFCNGRLGIVHVGSLAQVQRAGILDVARVQPLPLGWAASQ